jgi:hypothetical protein
VAREYRIWADMLDRCRNPGKQAYPLYGGRGITVDPSWNDYATFFRDVGPRPSPKHSLDRIDNERGYGPGNVRWATGIEQARNTRRNRLLSHEGRTLTMAEWAERTGVSYAVIRSRLARGWTVERTLETPVGPAGPKGEASPQAKLSASDVVAMRHRRNVDRVPLKQLALEYGVSESSVSLIANRRLWRHVP